MLEYIPKGGMCATCKHQDRDCSHLPFNEMRIIDYNETLAVVKCDEFERYSVNRKELMAFKWGGRNQESNDE